jgi:hypothetical protein
VLYLIAITPPERIYWAYTKEWCGFNVYYMNTAPFVCVYSVYNYLSILKERQGYWKEERWKYIERVREEMIERREKRTRAISRLFAVPVLQSSTWQLNERCEGAADKDENQREKDG